MEKNSKSNGIKNPTAFPTQTYQFDRASQYHDQEHPVHYQTGGMDLRDYFAAKAMTVLLQGYTKPEQFFDITAKRAYMMADEMLKERLKE